jgi:hypothetical protein
MRRLAVTTFAVIYAALIISVSAQRAEEWAVKEAESFSHKQVLHGFKTFGKSGKPDSHVLQTRLLETGFVVELPREAATSPAPSQRHTIRPPADLYVSPFARLISSRAPPSLT